jgi:hypothetical protein
MGFFEYFDAGYMLLNALTLIAALTATKQDDGVIGRVKNLADKLKVIFRR